MLRQGMGLTVKIAGVNANALNLQQQMLEYNPKKRISSSQALRHFYFNEAPIAVMNIAAQIPDNEWKVFVHQEKLNGTES
jgi:serine/threonine protein kinase